MLDNQSVSGPRETTQSPFLLVCQKQLHKAPCDLTQLQSSAPDWTRWLPEVPSHLHFCYLNVASRQSASWCSVVGAISRTETSQVNSTQPRQEQWGLGHSLQPAWEPEEGKSTILHKTQLKKNTLKCCPITQPTEIIKIQDYNDPGISKSYTQSQDFCFHRLAFGHAVPSA